VFTFSAVLLFGIVLAAMLRARTVTAAAAIVASLFGFYLASTGIAPGVTHTVTAIAHTIAQIH
jgi:hypothetical protein